MHLFCQTPDVFQSAQRQEHLAQYCVYNTPQVDESVCWVEMALPYIYREAVSLQTLDPDVQI